MIELAGAVLAEAPLEDHEISPGITGFLVTFGLAIVVIGLMFLFVRSLRKVNRAFARRDGTSATSTALSNDRRVEASIGSAWPYADPASAEEADRAAGVQGASGAETALVDEQDDDGERASDEAIDGERAEPGK